MKAVRLTHACWLNDRVHGDDGDPLVLDDEEAAVHARSGLVVYDVVLQGQLDGVVPAQEIPVVKKEPALDPDDLLDHIEAVAPVTPQEFDAFTQQHDVTWEEVPAAESATEMKRPYGNASKAAWVDWAVHSGADPSEAAGLTKSELMSRYGERL